MSKSVSSSSAVREFPPPGFIPTRDPLIFKSPSGAYVFMSPLKSRTLQFGSEDADINSIVKRLAPNGVLPPPVPGVGYYGDRTREPQDLATALNQVREAELAFQRLPAVVRAGMMNDPRNLVPWLRDPDNLAMARKYGLVKPEAAKPAPAPGGPGAGAPAAAAAAAAAAEAPKDGPK